MLWHKAQGAGGIGRLQINQEYVGTTTGFRSIDYSFSVTTSTPKAGRELYAAIPLIPGTGTDVIGVTFGGSAMTEVYQVTNGSRALVSFWKIADDSTTSATLAVDVDNGANHIGESATVFSVYNAADAIADSATTTSLTAGDVSLSISAGKGDGLIYCYATRGVGGTGNDSKIVASSPSVTVTESFNLDLNTNDWAGAGYVAPENMTTAISSITRNLTDAGGTTADAAIGAIVLTRG